MKIFPLLPLMLASGLASAQSNLPQVSDPEQTSKARTIGSMIDEGLNAAEVAKAQLALKSGVPEEVVRLSYPNAFPKLAAPTGPTTEAFNNCSVLANNPEVRRKIEEKLNDPVEPLNVANSMPTRLKPKAERDFYFYLRPIYEKGDIARQVNVQIQWRFAKAELRDWLPNGISCEISYSTTMKGTIALNDGERPNWERGKPTSIIHLDTSLMTVYEAKGMKQTDGKVEVKVRGLARVF
ncbi:hypothetical protein EJP67_28420 [Variovorax guangxiensis]|uniref:Uncharacterized protein n=1 Tax=Variovorax guangxiensis TaxID=1775474 RepID=A0A3S0ZS89_9BURK|nr:hypothetical protein [Variovorax guangxiensis]RUR70985.1 hypothetical protein EJP67_28420 [Variovorax guangxiensis]